MAKGIDLTSKEWLNLIFEGRNKEYGAYELRENSSNRHITALLIVLAMCLTLIYFPQLIKSITKVPHRPPVVISQKDEIKVAEVESTKIIEPVIPIDKGVSPDQALSRAMKFTNLVIVPDANVSDEDIASTQDAMTESGAVIATVNLDGEIGGTRHVDDPIGDPSVSTVESPIIRDYVDQPPLFPGGDKALMKWLNDNLVYPTIAAERGIEGQVVLRFVVGPEGYVGQIEILRSLDPSCDAEAIRVVKKMPKWIPGKQSGSAVYVWYNLPIRFRLQR
jgi:protein TonB